MEVSAAGLYAIGSGVSALAGSPASSILFEWLQNWFQKRRLSKRVRGLVLLKGTTTMCSKLTTSDVVYIDCDSLLQTLQVPRDAEELARAPAGLNPVDAMLAYSVIKRHIGNVCSVFNGKIILVSKSLDLLNALPVKSDNIYFAVFSRDMELTIGVIYANEKEHHEAEVEKFRIMRAIPEERVYIVDSLKDLYDKTATRFGSKRVQL